MRAAEIVSTENVERRVLGLTNPGLKKTGHFATTPNLVGRDPTDSSRRNRFSASPHTGGAAHHHRGEGAYTCTNGERCWMEPGDLILTPAWSYHDHKNEGNGPMLWLDGLDVPLIDAMDTIFFELYPGKRSQVLTQPDQASMARFAAPGMRPANFSWDKSYSPLTKYPGKKCCRRSMTCSLRMPALTTISGSNIQSAYRRSGDAHHRLLCAEVARRRAYAKASPQ